MNSDTSPVQLIWIFNSLFWHSIAVVIWVLILIFGHINIDQMVILVASFIFILYEGGLIAGDYLRRKSFHFQFADDSIFFNQRPGPALKPELRLPYDRIKNLRFDRTLFDRIFCLASLTITFEPQDENDNNDWLNIRGYFGIGTSAREMLAFMGKRVHIPGLKLADANQIRNLIQEKTNTSTLS